MTFERWNILIRTLMLGAIAGAVVWLVFYQANAVQQDLHAVSVQSAALEKSAQEFIPAQSLDMAKVNGVVGSVQGVVNEAHTALQKVNAPCAPGPCGLLADSAKTLNTARLTMGQVEIAANHEDKNLGALDQQEATIYAGANDDVQALHALLASPDLLQTVHNLDTTSAALADSTKQADGILTDAKFEADKLTHPSRKKLTFWGALLATGETIQKLSPPLF